MEGDNILVNWILGNERILWKAMILQSSSVYAPPAIGKGSISYEQYKK